MELWGSGWWLNCDTRNRHNTTARNLTARVAICWRHHCDVIATEIIQAAVDWTSDARSISDRYLLTA